MKKKISKVLILSLCVLLLAGCQKNAETDKDTEEDKKTESLEVEDTEKEDTDEEDPVEDQNGDEQGSADSSGDVQGPKTVTVFAPNENADGFVTVNLEASAVTEGWVTEQLIANGTLPADVQALSCKKTEVDGVTSLDLDMNQAFQKFLQSMGTAGEYVVMGSVTNTFLNAYDCEQVKITVEGQTLATGHAEYPGYMTKFE
ncbi:GerMN domain-containing protein [Dorea phocaeensis]|uniref:GerMN domain-containing protein n=1 Tax=Dorea phocaeensis TaxID=2040291 RepID=UPI000C78A89F|nr:GerMN domain-containing protein [Dorea phocaeensis]